MKKAAIGIFIIITWLLAIGIVMSLSASSGFSETKFDNSFHLFQSHLGKVLGGAVLFVGFCFVPYTFLQRCAKPLLIVSLALLLLTLFVGVGAKGAERWLGIGSFRFQPSDIAKYVLVIFLANFLSKKGEKIKSLTEGLIPALIWIGLVVFLIIIEPNLSNAMLILMISFAMLYLGNARLLHLGVLAGVGIALFALLIVIYPHAHSRVNSYGGQGNHQLQQSIIALGSGGIRGIGLGHSLQAKLFLPESYGDFVFSIIGEELGFIGVTIVMFLYLMIFVLGIRVAMCAPTKFGQLLAFGISFTILIYSFVNIAVASGTVPTTGLPLPFISFGGTSLWIACSAAGLLVNMGFMNALNLVKPKVEEAYAQ